MGHEVRTHTRTRNGRTTTVRRRSQADRNGSGLTLAEQRKRNNLERRVMRERQQTRLAEEFGVQPASSPGQRSRKTRGPHPKHAKRHAKKAVKLARKHKVRAVAHLGWAAAHLGAWGAWSGGKHAWRGMRAGGRKVRGWMAGRKQATA